ncbi:MAG: ATP synthase F1 subunit delta [Sedimentisphaerales bacterium]|jgi:ATP synthase F1 delta subunit
MSAYNKTTNRIEEAYALAIFDIAVEQHLVDVVKSDLDSLGNIFAKEEDLSKLMWSPYFTRQYKTDLLLKAFSGTFSELTMNCMMIAAKHNRLKFLPEIVACFDRLWDEHHGFVPVKITTSEKLDDERIKKLSDDIASSLKRKIRIESSTDPSIIGGIVIRYGDKIIDNTIRTRLLNAVKTITSEEKRWINFDEV